MLFSGKRALSLYRGNWCIPISFSRRNIRVKGGVFFLFLRWTFLATRWPESGSGQKGQIQGALAYHRCQKCGRLEPATSYLQKVETSKQGSRLPEDPQNVHFVHVCGAVVSQPAMRCTDGYHTGPRRPPYKSGRDPKIGLWQKSRS